MYSQIDSNKRKTTILILIFVMLIIAIGWALDVYYGGGYAIVVGAMVISIIMTLVSYYKGDKIALRSTGAKETTKEADPYVYRMVENMAITAGIPTPKVYIIDSPAMNAFATGRDPEHASIAVTKGIVKALENEELEGVIDIAIILIVRMIGKGRPKMSYNEYLQKYGSIGPYSKSDTQKYL